MRWLSFYRLILFAALAGLVAIASTDCSAKMYITCTGLCQNVLPCNDTYEQCLTSCTAQQEKCNRVGHPAAFLAYVACTSDAGFSCDDGGVPIANPPCGPQEAELVQCESEDDASVPVPDGSSAMAASCVDSGSSCLMCCKDLFSEGAREYMNAVSSCVCGDGGQCQSQCATEACAKDPVMPADAGDPCDLCLSQVINEQAADVGVCVLPVTLACNLAKNYECAAYVNCASQIGCTN